MGAGIASIAAVGYFLNEHVKPFAVAFLIGYLIFTGTEVSFLVKEARKTD